MYIVNEQTETEIIVNKSRFIGKTFSVTDATKIKPLIKNLKSEYKDATHICYAFIIGKNGEIAGASDDGEPAGTAGKPMLEILKANCVTNILIVAIRYFGGIKLGTGGLVHAYGQTAKELIANCEKEELVDKSKIEISISYEFYNNVKTILEKNFAQIIEDNFSEAINLLFEIPIVSKEQIVKELIDSTNGKITINYK